MDFLFIIIPIIAIVAGVLIYIYETKINSQVEELSAKIRALKELNESITFHKLNDVIDISQHYDNKWHYNKTQPAYLMSAYLKDNIESFALYIQKIQENRQNKVIYDKRANEIMAMEYDINFETIDISEKSFKRREVRLFNKMIAPQYVDCTVNVHMSYSSPKGRVNISKGDTFTFDQLLTSYNSISRSKLDYKTYRALSTVERGKVSDSLRYDIMHRDGFRCVLCGASANEGVQLHVDHIVPIAKGGKSTPDNLRTLCERCNVGKSDKIE